MAKFAADALYPNRKLSDGTIEYIGEGQSGNQSVTYGNKALLRAEEVGSSFEVYENHGKNRYSRLGSYRVHSHRFETLSAVDGTPRKAYKFILIPVD